MTIFRKKIGLPSHLYEKVFAYFVTSQISFNIIYYLKFINQKQNIPAHILPGVILLCLPLVSYDPYLCIVFVTLSLGFSGSMNVTNLQNSQDLAPNYSATLYGLINAIGSTSGFLAPLVVGILTQQRVLFNLYDTIF